MVLGRGEGGYLRWQVIGSPERLDSREDSHIRYIPATGNGRIQAIKHSTQPAHWPVSRSGHTADRLLHSTCRGPTGRICAFPGPHPLSLSSLSSPVRGSSRRSVTRVDSFLGRLRRRMGPRHVHVFSATSYRLGAGRWRCGRLVPDRWKACGMLFFHELERIVSSCGIWHEISLLCLDKRKFGPMRLHAFLHRSVGTGRLEGMRERGREREARERWVCW
jgi:hypothetical protein